MWGVIRSCVCVRCPDFLYIVSRLFMSNVSWLSNSDQQFDAISDSKRSIYEAKYNGVGKEYSNVRENL